MPVDLSVKQVPDEVAEKLRERAKLNHRSLQGELRAILETAARGAPSEPPQRTMTFDEFYEQQKSFGITTPSESTAWIRELRDSR